PRRKPAGAGRAPLESQTVSRLAPEQRRFIDSPRDSAHISATAHAPESRPVNVVPINPLSSFHPAVATWFAEAFAAPTEAQRAAWAAVLRGNPTLLAAPTGSGKTLAAFLGAIDSLVRQGVAGDLKDETQVVYVSPLKALSNDVERNLEAPLAGVRDALAALGLPDVAIRTLVRTGDTPQADRQSMRKRPPHIVVTTPESLYIFLTTESRRPIL